MNAADVLQRLGETLGSTATVKSVFGDPIQANGKTVVPVAKVAYGFGGGFGAGKHGKKSDQQGEGGGGGGVRAFPAGAAFGAIILSRRREWPVAPKSLS